MKKYHYLLLIPLFLIALYFLSNVIIDKINEIVCENIVNNKIVSPDKKNVLYIFERNCGGTTDVFYNVSLESNGEELSPRRGNVTHSKTLLKAKWIDNNNVELHIKNNNDIIWSKGKVGNINFIYKKSP